MSPPPIVVRAGLVAAGRGVPGSAEEYRAEPDRLVRQLAETLGRLHGLPAPDDGVVAALPPDELAASVRAALPAPPSPPVVSDPAYQHVEVDRLLGILEDRTARVADAGRPLVLTHGRPDLGALRVVDGAAVGLDDWQGLRRSDPCRDLAPALRSLISVFGPGVAPAFAAAYPHDTPPAEVLDWFVLADVLLDAAAPRDAVAGPDPAGGARP